MVLMLVCDHKQPLRDFRGDGPQAPGPAPGYSEPTYVGGSQRGVRIRELLLSDRHRGASSVKTSYVWTATESTAAGVAAGRARAPVACSAARRTFVDVAIRPEGPSQSAGGGGGGAMGEAVAAAARPNSTNTSIWGSFREVSSVVLDLVI